MASAIGENVRVDPMLWQFAVGCSCLLLLAPATPRTRWTYLAESETRGAAGTMTHSAGWEWVVLLCGILAIASLVGMSRRSVSGIAAMLAFAAAAAAALGHWLHFQSGPIATFESVVHPAPAAPFFGAIAIAGLATTGISLWWMQHRHGHSRSASTSGF